MTNQEIYDFIKENVSDHINLEGSGYIADDYVKEGYGQIKGGYFDVAYKRGKKIWKVEAEPSQKWHFLVSYYGVKKENSKFNMHDKASLGRLMCPQLMMWIAELAGLDKNVLRKAMNKAIDYEKIHKTKNSRKIKYDVLNEMLYWGEITQIIKSANNWEEVIKEVNDNINSSFKVL